MVNIRNVKKHLKNSIIRGTGEAIKIMRRYPQIDFTKYIIAASVKNLAYDPQCEGSRANYVYELIQLSSKKEIIKAAILSALNKEREDTWALNQLFDLAALFAKDGDKQARRAMYKRFGKKIIPYSDWVGEDAIISLDGLKGLLHVAEVVGKRLIKDPEDNEEPYRVEFFQKDNPEIDVYNELKSASLSNIAIKKYLESILINRGDKPIRQGTSWNYEIVSENIKNGKRIPVTSKGARELSDGDILKLADDFLRQNNRLGKLKYLQVFRFVQFPYDYKPILACAKNKYPNRDRLVGNAVDALQFFSGKDIRSFAINKLKHTRNPAIFLGLLISNYKKGDSNFICKIIDKTSDTDKLHGIAAAVRDIYSKNKMADCSLPLIALYQKLTCSICREHVVELLVENSVLPDTILDELQFDCYDDIRKLYKTLNVNRASSGI